MAGEYLLIGKQHTKMKRGDDLFSYYFTRPFSRYENEHSISVLGNAVEKVSCFVDFPCKPGDEIQIVYSGNFQGKLVLSDIIVI